MQNSPAVIQPSTGYAQGRFTSVINQETALSTMHGHWLWYLFNKLHSVTFLLFNVATVYPVSVTSNKQEM
jgi:hypothetical protein